MAYICAVAAKAGFDCGNPYRHDYGVDLEINCVKLDRRGKRHFSGMPLRIQAKASQNYKIQDDGLIAYKLKIDNYNTLIMDGGDGGPPYILVLYCMPSEDSEWLKICNGHTCNGHMVLKHCGYWKSLKGDEESDNKDNIIIKIPITNIFNESSLKYIMKTIQGDGPL